METTKYDGNKTVAWADVGWQPKIAPAVAPVKMKLSEAIRKGHPDVSEHCGWSGCAIGAAYYAVTGRKFEAFNREIGGIPEAVAREFGWDEKVAREISGRHLRGEKRLDIANWLEARGL